MAARAPTLGSPASWRESLNVWRNQIIASPGFQRWAARSPLTRFIARRRARALFDLCAGFVYAQALLACVRLHVCEHLAEGPRSVEALSRLIDLKPDATLRLLRAAASLRLVRNWPDGRFALDDLGAALIGNPSIMNCSTTTCATPWRCCAAKRRRACRNSGLTPMIVPARRPGTGAPATTPPTAR